MRVPVRLGNVRSVVFSEDVGTGTTGVIVVCQDGHDVVHFVDDKRIADLLTARPRPVLTGVQALLFARSVLTSRQWRYVRQMITGGAPNE